ncbi:hypothetical protein [Oryza sativa Japonica Group]|uniref:Uncharacterized protein n=1 Tax=Oryza sativa subsp. japonica TaxID=39947 RepID=Q5ZBQ8_ORYSJ|nr:hypothetical protein [Oryza sativa Japonica Group]
MEEGKTTTRPRRRLRWRYADELAATCTPPDERRGCGRRDDDDNLTSEGVSLMSVEAVGGASSMRLRPRCQLLHREHAPVHQQRHGSGGHDARPILRHRPHPATEELAELGHHVLSTASPSYSPGHVCHYYVLKTQAPSLL